MKDEVVAFDCKTCRIVCGRLRYSIQWHFENASVDGESCLSLNSLEHDGWAVGLLFRRTNVSQDAN
eukprot:scaffold295605_cov89-Cyclotella_meneghiniana.AAC.1